MSKNAFSMRNLDAVGQNRRDWYILQTGFDPSGSNAARKSVISLKNRSLHELIKICLHQVMNPAEVI